MKHIFIVRHGESTANANAEGLLSGENKSYVIDSSFQLTSTGRTQAYNAGKKISKLLSDEKCNIYVSPYMRTRQTAQEIVKALIDNNFTNIRKIEDPRLVEQDFGDFDFQYRAMWRQISPHSFRVNQAKYHDPLGRFFARLENGENLLDVYNRVSLFVTTRLEREMEKTNIIVTHGNTERVLLMFLFNLQVESFYSMKLYDNGSVIHIGYDEEEKQYTFFSEL